MGRDITGLRIDKIPNNAPKSNGINHVTIHVTPRIAAEKVEETGSNADDENGLEKQDVPEALLSSSVAPVAHATEEELSGAAINGGVKIADTDLPMTANLSQQTSPLASRMPVRSNDNQYHDDEDNISLASSVATSVRSTMSRVTVPVAPKFVCNDRLSRRKEFYTKLEEKHKALEAEKIEVAARTKEEEEAAIKLLRKTAAYKANPVPSFYREGPPPKVELKKLPVTRAKSPNLSRRKSCSDAMRPSPSPDEKCNNNCARIKRHSIGPLKPFTTTSTPPPATSTTTHRNKNPTFSRNLTSSAPKTKDATTGSRRSSKEGIVTPPPVKSKSFPGKTNTSAVNRSKIHVKEVKDTSSKVAETMADPTAMKDNIRTDTDAESKTCSNEVDKTSLKVADMSMADGVSDTSSTAMKEKVKADTDIPIVEEDDEAVEPMTADIALET